MGRQSNAYYDDGSQLSPLDSEKHIFAQIAAYLGRLVGISGNDQIPHAGGIPVVPAGGVERTFTLTAATGNGSVSAGAKSVAFSSSSDFAGTITGAAFAASQAIGAAVDGADTIGEIPYTVSAGTLYIGKVV